MLNTCSDSFSSCYLCHSFSSCLFTVGSVLQGEGGKLKANAPTWYMLSGSPTHHLPHSECEHPASHGAVVTVHWVISPVCWCRADGTLTPQHKYIVWLLQLFQNWNSFHGGFSFLPPWLLTLKALWATAPERLLKPYIWNNPMFTSVLIKRLPIPAQRLLLAECLFFQ